MQKKIRSLEKLLPSDEDLILLDNSILSADPFLNDVIIIDLKRQINKMTTKIRKYKLKLKEINP